jgi:hypothetical protein
MPQLPLVVVWFAVLSGYIPYTMGYAFLNPIVVTAYGLLGWLVAANVARLTVAMAGATGTTVLALAVVNLTSGTPHLVLPPPLILAGSFSLSVTSALAASRLPSRNARWLFAGLAVLFYFNGALPYDVKMWVSEHTTNQDLLIFSVILNLIFVGTWRVLR